MGHQELRSEFFESIENQKEFNDFSSLLLLFDRLTIKITLNHCYGVTSLLVTRHTEANDEQVPEVEIHICTNKDLVRSIWNTLPFNNIPARMII